MVTYNQKEFDNAIATAAEAATTKALAEIEKLSNENRTLNEQFAQQTYRIPCRNFYRLQCSQRKIVFPVFSFFISLKKLNF